MEKTYCLPVKITRHCSRLGLTKAGFLSLLFVGIVTSVAFSQTACDTLIAKDGRQIAVEIIRTNSEGMFYTKCSETSGQQYFMSSAKILELRKPGGAAPIKIAPPPPQKPLKEKELRLKNETDLSKPKTIIWAGLTVPQLVLFDVDFTTTERSFFQFGAEIGFKDSGLRLGVIANPIFLKDNNYYTTFEQKGVSGELGLVLKSFTKGRLTGNVSKAYWGLDLRTGRQAYLYNSGSGSPDSNVKYTWISVMPRIGVQFNYQMFAFDLALPIGYQRYHYTLNSEYSNSNYEEGSLAFRPLASIGFRF